MLSAEHQAIADLFKFSQPKPITDLMGSIAGILGIVPSGYVHADLSDANMTIYPVQLGAERLMVLYNNKGERAYALVLEVQQEAEPSKLDSWPIYAWAGKRALGVPAEVVVIAPKDNVARWAERTITNGPNAFRVRVIGRHNLPVITNEKEAKANPLLALLSASVHLQSSTPPEGSKQTQADKNLQDARQLTIADEIAHNMDLPERDKFIRVLFNLLNAEAQKMALESSGPILTSFEQKAQAQVQEAQAQTQEAKAQAQEAKAQAQEAEAQIQEAKAQAQEAQALAARVQAAMLDVASNWYSARFHEELPPELRQELGEVERTASDRLAQLVLAIQNASSQQEVAELIRAAAKPTA